MVEYDYEYEKPKRKRKPKRGEDLITYEEGPIVYNVGPGSGCVGNGLIFTAIITSVVVGAVILFVMGLIVPMNEAGGVANTVLTALHDRDYAQIYPFMNERTQQRYGTSESFVQAIVNEDLPVITDWYFDNFEAQGNSLTPDVGTWGHIAGGVTFADGEHARIVVRIEHDGEAWKIEGITIWADNGFITIP